MRGVFEGLDARARILMVVGITVIIVSTGRGELLPFAGYVPLVLLLALTGRVKAGYLARRCLVAAPFILLAGGMLAVENGWGWQGTPRGLEAAASVAGKAFAAVFLLAFLTATTPLEELLGALQRLGSPASLNLILAMMHRYSSLFGEEYKRMERARDSRTVRPLGKERFAIYGRQLGALILRSWDRAERVHAAMLARGFDGKWPQAGPAAFRAQDAAFLAASLLVFLATRLVLG